MHSRPGTSKERGWNVPNSKTETGLAEWTSKIKAMQRQVDADEEAEQKRLEEEIAASRLARLRRNQGLGYNGRANGVGVLQPPDHPPDGSRTSGTTKAAVGRQNKEDVNSGVPKGQSTGAAASSVPPAPIISGRSVGHELSRSIPQQDDYDIPRPRYIQPRPPVFEMGGITSMPGIAQLNTRVTDFDQGGSETNKQKWPESPRAIVEKFISQPQSHIPETPDLPEHTTNISQLRSSTRRTVIPPTHYHPDKQSTTILFDANRDNDTSSRKPSVSFVLSSKPITQLESSRRLSEGVSANSQKSSVTMKSLARPISPRTRAHSSLPETPPSAIPSPAFLRHPLQKDPTPSISRLQGRGFVQSMVKVSTQLESPPPSETIPEKGSASGGRRVSLLDRLQQYESPQTPSPSSPTTRPLRRLTTADPKSGSPQQIQFSPQTGSTKSLKSAASFPSLRPIHADVAIPIQSYNKQDGLGSATTLLVYKPKLTAPPSQTTEVDELGFRNKSNEVVVTKGGRKLPAPSGSPLSHLTKDRVRKPRKARHINSNPPMLAPGPIQLLNIGANVQPVLPLAQPQPPTSISSQQPKNRLATKSGVIPIDPNDAPSAPPRNGELPSKVHATCSLQGAPEDQLNSPPQAGGISTLDPPIVTLVSTKKGERGPLQLSPNISRIPSTGNRATVVDLAQFLHGQSPQHMVNAIDVDDKISLGSDPPLRLNPGQTRPSLSFITDGGKHKSSYEKYSSTILPSLQEETTPMPSPGTLKYVPRQTFAGPLSHLSWSSLIHDGCPRPEDFNALESASIEIMLKSYQPLVISGPPSQSISVEVFVITGNIATSLSHEEYIFYDTEFITIIHRSKSSESGLVSTVMWVWKGKCCTPGEEQERKLQEFERRYGTIAWVVRQNSEQPDLVRVLGGCLAVRQGTRAHWTSDNTAMHLIRSKGGVVFIDEHDLNIKNLCSAFSYCLSILGTLYIWHGRGSTSQERKAALDYSRCLNKEASASVELFEDGDDEDEMFWLILGNEEFARADYWRWRKSSPMVDPHIWRVDTTAGNTPLLPIGSFSEERETHSSVYIIDCVWELYVLVGRDARSHHTRILLALKITSELSFRVAPERPYTPTIHVLLLPTQLPRDLRINLRGFNEQLTENTMDTPDQMNILTSIDALTYVQSTFCDQLVT